MLEYEDLEELRNYNGKYVEYANGAVYVIELKGKTLIAGDAFNTGVRPVVSVNCDDFDFVDDCLEALMQKLDEYNDNLFARDSKRRKRKDARTTFENKYIRQLQSLLRFLKEKDSRDDTDFIYRYGNDIKALIEDLKFNKNNY